jgi:NAD(P)-dependent dehydrogenase (short-subunit alcohol dehydrogenase family)
MPTPGDRVAIVTGSSRGIGRGIALQLARDGFFVVVNFVARKEAAEDVVRQIASFGRPAVAIRADVSRPDDRESLVDQVLNRQGRIDLLVNNAGITSQGRKDLLEATEESWDVVFDTNLKGPFFLAQRVAREMIKLISHGVIPTAQIVNISSISSYAVSTNRADYCMAKAAMQMMTWLLADRLAEHHIGVFEVCPGVIASDMTAPVKEKYDRLIAEGLTPIRRWGEPEDVARAVSAIASLAFPFSTGERINVDGGFHLRRL